MPHRTPRTQAIAHGFVPQPLPAWNPARNAPVSMVGTGQPGYPLNREHQEAVDLKRAFDTQAPLAPGASTASRPGKW